MAVNVPAGAPVAPSQPPIRILAYFDAILVIVAAPILLLIGVPALGYGIGAGAWLVLRVAGVGIERYAASRDVRAEISVRLGYLLGRLFALALAVILARRAGGRDDGLTALVVIVFAFTIQLGISAMNRPRRRRPG